MVIDPSSSEFSERLENSLQSFLQELNKKNVTCNIAEHPEAKFYETPAGTIFSEKSSDHKKLEIVSI